MQQYNQGQNQSQTPVPSPNILPNDQTSNNYSNTPFQFQNSQQQISQSQSQVNQNYNYPYQEQILKQPNSTNLINSISRSSKKINSQSSIFNLKNVLITVLSLYSIFSFVWIAILYLGVDGNKMCLEDNIICKISVPFTKQAGVAVNSNIETKNQLVKQKSAKNFIKDIWQNQAILNDNLVTRQQSVEKSISAYTSYIQNYIRFINDKPELLKGISKVELDNKKIDIEQQIANLNLLQDNNYQNKISNQKQINELYQELGERQDNSFISQR